MSEPQHAGKVRDDAAPQGEEGDELDVSPATEANPPSAEESLALLKQLTVGTIIDGKYRVDSVLGKGAMGVVLAATHVHLKERVALKFLSARNSTTDDFHSRFRREAQVSAKLRNEHITRVIDVGVWREKIPFMVMDLLVGDDLRKTLRAAPGARLPVATALEYIVQICEGLAEAHSHGIVHRDLKPSNLFVTKRHDGTDLIRILDFGISKWSAQEEQLDELTQTGVVLGSPKYMSPEQLFGSAQVDARADVWSLGAIFYEMVTGRPPFDFPTLTRICAELATENPPPPMSRIVPDVPEALEVAVQQAFVRDRDRRTQNVADLAGTLLEAVEAPFANQVRQRIATVLDPRGQGGGLLSTSGALMGTGNYRSLSISSSRSPLSSSSAIRMAGEQQSPSSAATAAGVEALVATDNGKAKKKGVVLGAIIGLVAVAGLAFAFVGGQHSKETPPPANAAATRPSTPAPTPPPAVAPTPPPVVPVVKAAPAPVPAPAPAPPPPAAHQTPAHHGGWGGGRSTSAPPAAAPAAPAPSAVAPAAAPTPKPAPATKVNPLDDRQ